MVHPSPSPFTSVAVLVAGLAARGIELHLEDGRLRFRGPAGALAAEDRTALQARRESVTAFLAARTAAAFPQAVPPAQRLRASMYQRVWWDLVRPSPVQLRMERVPLALPLARAAPEAAVAAVRAVVARHVSLLSRFAEEEGELRVVLNDAADFEVEVEPVADAGGLPGAIAAFFGRPLRVDGTWLTAARVFSVAGGPTVILIVAHHIVFDGTSMGIVTEDLKRHLSGAGFEDGSAAFTDYADWERGWFEGGGAGPVIAWWRDWLAQAPRLTAPGGGDLAWVPGERIDHPLPLGPQVSAMLVEAAAATRATPFVVVLAAFGLALARWSGTERFPVRAVGDLRTTPAVARTVGLMICADPVEVSAPEDGDFGDLVRRTGAEYEAATTLRLPSHPAGTGAGYPELHEQIAATINYVPRSALPGARQPWETEAAETAPWPAPPNRAQTLPWPVNLPPIFLRLWEAPDGLTGRLEFNGAVLGPEDQAAMVAAFMAALGVAAATASGGR